MNSYLYREKVVLADMAAALGNVSGRAYWQADAEELLPRLQKMFYVAGDRAFFQDRYFNGSSSTIQGCEGYAALFSGVATQAQGNHIDIRNPHHDLVSREISERLLAGAASAVAKTLSDPSLFLLNFSLVGAHRNPHHTSISSDVSERLLCGRHAALDLQGQPQLQRDELLAGPDLARPDVVCK